MKTAAPPAENPLVSLIVNIVLPVTILNKGGQYVDPRYALALALLLPLGYGVQDYVRRRHKNYVSLIGLINICLTGALAIGGLHGMWFAVKDATLPFALGALTLGSAWTKSPAAKLMFYNPQILNLELIDREVAARGKSHELDGLLKRTTLWLSTSFFLSAILNFVVAARIFLDIDQTLSATDQHRVLNEQIARMTGISFVVIALPLMVLTGILVYWFLRRLSGLTGQPLTDLMKS